MGLWKMRTHVMFFFCNCLKVKNAPSPVTKVDQNEENIELGLGASPGPERTGTDGVSLSVHLLFPVICSRLNRVNFESDGVITEVYPTFI